jgi:hypothetical protein
MPKPSSKRERVARFPKPVKELTNLAISYWLWPPDEETTRALEVECPVCHQIRGLPCVREQSMLISAKRGTVMLCRPHWQRVTVAMGPRPNGHQL